MNEKDLMLTQEDYEAMGLTPEQIELFEDANAIAESVNMLPDDPMVMIDVIENKMPDGFEAGIKYLDELAQKNPEAFAKLITMTALVSHVEKTPEPEDHVDPLLAKLSKEQLDKAEREFYTMISGLSQEKKKEFFDLLRTVSQEQKAELVDNLVKR